MKRLGIPPVTVPPLFTDSAKEKQIKEERSRVEFEKTMQGPDHLRDLYPDMCKSEYGEFNSSPSHTRKAASRVQGRKVDLGSSNRGRGAVVPSGHTHATTALHKGVRRLK